MSLILKVCKEPITIKYDYRLYMNIVGDEPKEQMDKFDGFLGGLLTDNADTILRFGVAASNKKLTMGNVADQLDEQNAFDDIRGITDEIIDGFCHAGFLTSKVREWMKLGSSMIKELKKAYKEESEDDSKRTKKEQEEFDKNLIQVKAQVEEAEVQMKLITDRVVLPEKKD